MAGNSNSVTNMNLVVQNAKSTISKSLSSHGHLVGLSNSTISNGYSCTLGGVESNGTIFTGSEDDGKDVILINENDVHLFEHQVSGHGTHGAQEKGLLKHKLGYILKPLQVPPLGTREVKFYQDVFRNCPNKEDWLTTLESFVPQFHGVASITKPSNVNGNSEPSGPTSAKYLVLADIIQGFQKPCVVDIKIGSQTWSPDAKESKIAHEKSKYKGTKFPIGICLTGMEYFDVGRNEICKKSKDFGKSLNPTSLKEALQEFFNEANSPSYHILAKTALTKLLKIQTVFETQRKVKMYGSSILIAYDADCFQCENYSIAETSGATSSNNSIPLRISMIDFAHVHPSEDESLDENYLFGLRNLIKIICDIVELSKKNNVESE